MIRNRRSKKLKRYLKYNIIKLLKKKSLTPSKRNFKYLFKDPLLKINSFLKLNVLKFNKSIGKSFGSIVCRFRSFGIKKRYRFIENIRISKIHEGILEQIEYNPTHTSLLARIYNSNLNYHFYIRYPDGIKLGFYIRSNFNDEVSRTGDCNILKNLIINRPIHNLNLFNKLNIARSAGTFCLILQKYTNYCLIRLPSKKTLYLSTLSQATMGRLSNRGYKLTTIGKAGRNRWLGFRPKVRGVAMNPVDHPHGGGEGKTSGGVKTSVSLWGKPTKQIKKKKKI